MEATEAYLTSLLQERGHLTVPQFQRRYVWRKKQQKALFESVMQQYRLVSEAGGPDVNAKHPDHFIGALVMMKGTRGKATEPRPLTIIDGQQRMMSVLIMLCALRDFQATDEDGELDAAMVHEFNANFLHNERASGVLRYRLVPQEPDRKPFLALLDGESNGEGESLIDQAYVNYWDWFSAGYDKGLVIDTDLFMRAVFERLAIVDITLDDTDNIHRIFQTLNSTGLPLKSVDLLKNYFFMLLGSDGDEVYLKQWLPMEHLLGRQVEDFLLSDIIAGGNKVGSRQVFEAYQDRFRVVEGDRVKIRRELAEIFRGSVAYAKVIRINSAGSQKVDAVLDRLRVWGAVPAHPLMLWLVRARDSGTISSTELVTALEMLEGYLVRRFLAQIPPNDLRSVFTSITVALNLGDDVLSQLRSSLQQGSRRWPSDPDLRKAIVERPIYEPRKSKQLLYVFQQIAQEMQGKEAPHLKPPKYSVEHILPQKLSDDWEADLKKWRDDPKKVHSEKLNVLGNLTTTGFNTEMSNHPFAEQKTKYLKKSGLLFNEEIWSRPQWTAAEIDARSASLATLAASIWAGPQR